MPPKDSQNRIPAENRRLCHDKALDCFGTAYIFEQRAAALRWRVNGLTFLGIVVPMLVGGIVCSFSVSPVLTKYLVTIAGLVGLIQFVFAAWSIVNGWNSSLSYCLESKSANYSLAERFCKLGASSDLSKAKFDFTLEMLEAELSWRNSLDDKIDISGKEKRVGMRAALRQYQRPCAGCGKVPTSLEEATDCGVCGK